MTRPLWLLKWEDLTDKQKAEVKAAFVNWDIGRWDNRNTGRSWDGKDFEGWASDHAFYFRRDGHLALKPEHCEPAFMADPKPKAPVETTTPRREKDGDVPFWLRQRLKDKT